MVAVSGIWGMYYREIKYRLMSLFWFSRMLEQSCCFSFTSAWSVQMKFFWINVSALTSSVHFMSQTVRSPQIAACLFCQWRLSVSLQVPYTGSVSLQVPYTSKLRDFCIFVDASLFFDYKIAEISFLVKSNPFWCIAALLSNSQKGKTTLF